MRVHLRQYAAALLALLMILCLLPAAALTADEPADEPVYEPVYEEPEPETEPEPEPEPEPVYEEPVYEEPEPEPADPVYEEPDDEEPDPEEEPSEEPSGEASEEDPAPTALSEIPVVVDDLLLQELESSHITEDEDGLYEIPFDDYIVGGWYNPDENAVYILWFLMEKLGMNTAAACGVLGNAVVESEFSPYALGDHGTSYGFLQWHNERFVDLRNWCMNNGLDYTTLTGQLYYLVYELYYYYPGVLNYLLSVENSAQGAYDAASYWCSNYERPANTAVQADYRGRIAREVYWPYYGWCKLSFDANGGSVHTDPLYVMADGVYGELPTPVRNFFVFEGWFTAREDTEQIQAVRIAEGDEVHLGGSVTLYARWEKEEFLDESLMFLQKELTPEEIAESTLAASGYPASQHSGLLLKAKNQMEEIVKPGRMCVPVLYV